MCTLIHTMAPPFSGNYPSHSMCPIQSLYHLASRLPGERPNGPPKGSAPRRHLLTAPPPLHVRLLTTHPDFTFPKHPARTYVHAASPTPAKPPAAQDHMYLVSALVSIHEAQSPEQDYIYCSNCVTFPLLHLL